MLVFTTFVHMSIFYFLVGTNYVRSQWFEVGGTDKLIKNQGNTSRNFLDTRGITSLLKLQSKWKDLLL